MKTGLRDYLRAAFNARPIGMIVPPNWIGLASFGLLGLLNPGFWILGAGLELGYLYALSMSPRFQRLVRGSRLAEAQAEWARQQQQQVARLDREARERYHALEQRCGRILAQQASAEAQGPQRGAEAEGLSRLLWIFLRLLQTRQAIRRVLSEAAGPEGDRQTLDERVARLEEQLADPALGEDLRKSLAGQLEILQQRLAKRAEAAEKLRFLEAELVRVEEQVELVREQAVINADPATVSQRIDQISAALSGTARWIQQQQKLYGQVEDLLVTPPPVIGPQAAEESA